MPKQSAAPPSKRKAASGRTCSRRRAHIGGYPRSEETRAGLIAAALDVFGEAGFASASTRAIACRAKVTLPVLAYHFGSKEGLYLACAEHISASIKSRMAPDFDGVLAKLAVPDQSRAELVDLLVMTMNAFIDSMVGTAEPQSWLYFIIREQVNPTAAFDILYSSFMSKAIGGCAILVGRLLGLPAEHPETRLRALACIGQVFIFRASRAGALRTLGWPDFEGDRLEQVRQAVRAQVERAFASGSN